LVPTNVTWCWKENFTIPFSFLGQPLVLLFFPTFVPPFQHRLFSYSSYCSFVQPLYHAKLRIFNYKTKGMYTKCISLLENKLLYVYVNTNTCMFSLRVGTIFILPIMHIFQWYYFCSWKENSSLINTTF